MTNPFLVGKAVLYAGPRADDADYYPAGGKPVTGIRVIYEERDATDEEGIRKAKVSRLIRVPRVSLAHDARKGDEIVIAPGTAAAKRFKVLRRPLQDDDPMRLDWELAVEEITL